LRRHLRGVRAELREHRLERRVVLRRAPHREHRRAVPHERGGWCITGGDSAATAPVAVRQQEQRFTQ